MTSLSDRHKDDDLWCPVCGKSQEFTVITTAEGTARFDCNAESFDDFGNAEVEEEVRQTVVKCRNCDSIVADVLS